MAQKLFVSITSSFSRIPLGPTNSNSIKSSCLDFKTIVEILEDTFYFKSILTEAKQNNHKILSFRFLKVLSVT